MHLQALVWFVAALFCASPAISAPVVGLVAAFASTAVGAVVVNAAIGIALSVGASLLKNLFNKQTQSRDPGTTVSLRVGGANPITFPLGATATAGVRVYYGVWTQLFGTPNEYLVDVLALSQMPLQGSFPTRIWVNDRIVNVRTDLPKTEMGWPIEEYFKNGAYYAWIDYHNGSQTGVDPYLSSKFGGHANYPWTNDMIGRGVAYVTFTARYDKDGLWQSGFPSLLVEIPSIPLYDPRLDSTNGGDGPMRWGDASTYAPSNNFMVHAYNVARGIYYGNEWVYGGQNWPALRLPASSWFAAMNACDTNVGGEPQFHGGGMVECDNEIATVLEELLRSSNALIAEIGGTYKVRVGAPGAPVMSFNDSNIVVTREQGYTPFPGLEETYNIARITYTEPTERWGTKESPERRDEEAILLDDGRELPFSVYLPWVLSNLTAQRIGKAALENGRRFRRHSMYHAPLFWLIEPLDVVSWTSDHNQYVNKEFDVERISGNSSLIQSVIIRENDPSDYVWNPVTDPLPYETIPLVQEITPAQPVTGWQVFPAIIRDEQGRARRPSIEVRFDGNLTDIEFVRVQVRVEGMETLAWDNTVPYPAEPIATASIILNGDFPPNTVFEVRGRFIPYTDRDTEWTGWFAVTTPDVKLVAGIDFDPYEGVIGFDQLGDDLAGYQDWIGSGIREIQRRLEEFDLWMADQDFGNEYDRQQIRQQLTAVYEQTSAEWSYAVDVVASENLALAQRVEQLDAEVFDPETGLPAVASAVDVLEAYSGPDGTLAQAITSLSASTTPGDVNEANFRMQVVSGPEGYSRIGAEGRQGGEGNWRSAGWYIDVPNNVTLPTRVAIAADQIVFMDGNGEFNPFVFQSGVAYFDSARIRNITADNINVNSLATNSAFVNTLTAQQGFFDHLTLKDGQIPAGIITAMMNVSGSGPIGPVPGAPGPYTRDQFIALTSGVINSHSGRPVLIFANAQGTWEVRVNPPESGRGSLTIDLAIIVNGAVVKIFASETTVGSLGTSGTISNSISGSDFYYYAPPGPGNVTVTIAARASGLFWSDSGAISSANLASIVATCNRF